MTETRLDSIDAPQNILELYAHQRMLNQLFWKYRFGFNLYEQQVLTKFF